MLNSPKTIEKEDLYKFVQPWLGTGLFTAPGSTILHNNWWERDAAYKLRLMPRQVWTAFTTRIYNFIDRSLTISSPHQSFFLAAQKWRKHRKLILPTFNQRILDTFITVFDQQSKILVRQMSCQIGEGEFEIFDYVSLCTLDIICGECFAVQWTIRETYFYFITFAFPNKRNCHGSAYECTDQSQLQICGLC